MRSRRARPARRLRDFEKEPYSSDEEPTPETEELSQQALKCVSRCHALGALRLLIRLTH